MSAQGDTLLEVFRENIKEEIVNMIEDLVLKNKNEKHQKIIEGYNERAVLCKLEIIERNRKYELLLKENEKLKKEIEEIKFQHENQIKIKNNDIMLLNDGVNMLAKANEK